jgi:hypothetical protein
MNIDRTIYEAIDDGTLTIEQVCSTVPWAFIEKTILEQVTASAVAKGFGAAAVQFVIDEHARSLRNSRADRLETLRQMLESGALSLQ